MDRKITISLKALIIGGLCAVLLFWGVLKIITIEKSLDNARLVIQVQQNSQNIQALDKALGEALKQIEELKKAK
jgi:hypothetical protein